MARLGGEIPCFQGAGETIGSSQIRSNSCACHSRSAARAASESAPAATHAAHAAHSAALETALAAGNSSSGGERRRGATVMR